MNKKYTLTDEQEKAVTHLYESDATLLIAATGSGKTLTTLHTLNELVLGGAIKKILILCPAKVVKVWTHEMKKWGLALPVIVSSYDSVHKVIKDTTIDAVVFDEITRLRSSGGAAFKKIRHVLKRFTWRCGLSATPVSEDLMGLYGMTMMLDGGERFGNRKDSFMLKYFNQMDYKGYKFEVKPEREKELINKVKELIYVMGADDSKVVERTVRVEVPSDIVTLQSRFTVSGKGADKIPVANAAVLQGKILQLNQGLLVDAGEILWLGRFDIVSDILADDLGGVVTYQFVLVREEFKRRYPWADFIDGSSTKQEFDEIITRWRNGGGKLLFLQVSAGSHGLDGLQFSSDRMIHFAPIYSNDRTIQLNGRLDRKGQRSATVTVINLVATGVYDEKVVNMVGDKKAIMPKFLSHLKS